jgi:hypothetical protein
MGRGSRIRSHIRMSQSTATSPLVPRSRDLFRVLPANALVSPVLTQLRLVLALLKRGSLTARCAAGCEQRSGGKNEKRATGRSNASRAGGSKLH